MQKQGTYDLVLLHGRVIDPETNRDMITNVGITDGKIVAIEPERLTGKEVIDAAGLVVAPGFIDLHMHGQTIPSMRMQAFDGVTTALELEAGSLPIGLAYEVAAREGRPLNYGFSASWALARMSRLDNVQLDGTYGVALANLGGPQWGKLTTPEQSQQILAQGDYLIDGSPAPRLARSGTNSSRSCATDEIQRAVASGCGRRYHRV